MLLINCGIERVVCERQYQQAKETEEMFGYSGVKLEYKYKELQTY